jgi:hypothetical protein
MADEVVLLGCGDVGPIHEPMERYSELVRDALAGADIRFAQVERTYSEGGELRAGSGGAHGRLPPRMASVISDCGFNVASMAGNHAMDWAPRHYSKRSTCCAARESTSSAPGRPGGGAAAGGHRIQRAACRDARLLFRSARRLCRRR